MYGMLLESIQHFLQKMYGEECWTKIRSLAEIDSHVFITHRCYSDELFLKLAEASVKVVGKNDLQIKDFMKCFGTFFVKFFSNYGYDQIIRVTGRNFADFLSSIDTIHENMRFGYPKMQSPNFYCTDETSTGLTLHYVSKRCGFKYYVIGQVEEIAKQFYSMEINTAIIGENIEKKRSHIVYRLQFNNHASRPPSPCHFGATSYLEKEMRIATFFDIFPFSFVIGRDMTIEMAGSCLLSTLGQEVVGQGVDGVFTLRRPRTEFSWENLQSKKVTFELISNTTKREKSNKTSPLITPKRNDTHSSLHRDLLSRNGPNKLPADSTQKEKSLLTENMHRDTSRNETYVTRCKKYNLLHDEMPECKNGLNQLTKDDIEFLMNEDNNNKGSSSTCRVLSRNSSTSSLYTADHSALHLKGEMKYITSWEKILFVCSPVISGLDEMMNLGLYMNDLGIYDRSQEMLLSGIAPLPQLEYARDQLIEKSRTLEENLRELAEERNRSDELLYVMMPRPIAERLKNGVDPADTCEHFDNVTVLFSYLDGFIKLCSYVDAMDVVTLVDRMFRVFDALSEQHGVYKFETLGDAVYMAVSGAPVRKERHAEPMASMAIAMIESMAQLKGGRDTLTITIGMHSGAAAAGLVGSKSPQYCLFGDTVNIASRLRKASLPMRITISEPCNKCLQGSNFMTEFRGKIPLKGVKEPMCSYWLLGRKSS